MLLVSSYIYYGGPLTAIDAILATVADGGGATVDTDRKAGGNKSNYHLINYLTLNPSRTSSLGETLPQRLLGGGVYSAVETTLTERQMAPSW
jgi:hypothetical protein